MSAMNSDQIDVDPKNSPIEARLAFAYAQTMKYRLVIWSSFGLGILNRLNRLTLWRIIFIDCLNNKTN